MLRLSALADRPPAAQQPLRPLCKDVAVEHMPSHVPGADEPASAVQAKCIVVTHHKWTAACRAAACSACAGPATCGERHGIRLAYPNLYPMTSDRLGQQAAAQEDREGVAAGGAVARLQDLDAAVREEVQAVGPPVAVQRGAVVPDAEEAQHLRRRARPRELPPYGTCPCCARMLRAAARRRAALKLDALL